MKTQVMKVVVAGCLVLGMESGVFAQGPLTPPGPPSVTMKTLSEVEPRIPITNIPITISSPGSYYLTRNFLCSSNGVNGIHISAQDVTLDLCGFTLTGPGSSSGNGIYAGVNTRIRNGIFRSWYGHEKYAIYLAGNGATVDGVNIQECASGIYGAANNLKIENCVLQAIISTSSCYGVRVAHATKIRNTHIASVGGAGDSYGIRTAEDCIISDCSVWAVTSPTTSGAAIYCQAGSIIERCNVNFNKVNGISVGRGCMVENNVCRDNGTGGEQVAGIQMNGGGNRVMNNHLTQNFYGLRGSMWYGTNFVAGNTFLFNSNALYQVPAAINLLGPVQTGVGDLTNHPWANFVN